MPRTADPELEERILNAAQRLWHSRGDQGLTLRGVAKAAGTTTTTVYKRFRNKEELRNALAERVRQRLAKAIVGASSLENAYRKYLRQAQANPREYRLLFGPAWIHVVGDRRRPRPVQNWMQAQLAARFGGARQEYLLAFYAFFLLLHGAASLIAVAPHSRANKEAE